MNLTQALEAALPELPPLQTREVFPRVHPRLIAREHIEAGAKAILAIVPDGPAHFFRFNQQQWTIVQAFNGERSYKDVCRELRIRTGVNYSEDNIRTFAEGLGELDFWHKTQQEESIALCHKLAENRHKKVTKKSNLGDLSHMELVYFDPDKFLTWTYARLKWVYSTWFTVLTLFLFAAMTYIFVDRWDEIWRDTLLYYNFTAKTWLDVGEFYMLFAVLAVLHESAHGMTCKHFGGESHKMGAFLIYLTPAVFCDVTQVWIYGGRGQRIATMVAGTWVELILCALMTFLWWGTAAGSWVHDLAYKFMLIGGIFVVIINMNPLVKMDGYYVISEWLRIPDLKGSSTVFFSSWIRRNIFRMPVSVPHLALTRKVLYAAYAMISGIYSYLLLMFAVRLVYRIFHASTPDWAFVPALALAFLIFRSRARKLLKFLKDFYLDKKEYMKAHPRIFIPAGVIAGVLFFVPLGRESVEARFALEPVNSAVLRASVPGTVTEVLVAEGQHVDAGAPVLRLRSLELETRAAETAQDLRLATMRSAQAQLHYADWTPSNQERQRLLHETELIQQQEDRLTVVAPLSGTVITPRVHDLQGSYVIGGTTIAEIADLTSLKARIFVPEPELRELRNVVDVSLHLDSHGRAFPGTFVSLSPSAQELPEGLMPPLKYKGMRPPAYFAATVVVSNAGGELRPGMSGTAKLSGARRSLAGKLWQPVADFFSRKIW